MNYSYRKGIYKGLGAGLIILVAAGIDQVVGQDLWGVNTITIGAVLMFIRNWLKVKMELGFK